MDLPYSAESDEAGTAGETVSVVLREQLNSTTVYYYTVSAVVENATVTVIAQPFTTPKYSKYFDMLQLNFTLPQKLYHSICAHVRSTILFSQIKPYKSCIQINPVH